METVNNYVEKNKFITVTPNSLVDFRLATEKELNEYKETHWKFPTLEFQTKLWEAMCSTLNSLTNLFFWFLIPCNKYEVIIDEIWSNFVDKTCNIQVKNKVTNEFRIAIGRQHADALCVPYYTAARLMCDSCTCKLNSNHTIEINSKYYYSYKIYDDFININNGIYDDPSNYKYHSAPNSVCYTTNIKYPNDFDKLLNLMRHYMEKRTASTNNSFFFLNSEERKLLKSGRKIQDFFSTYKDEINKFNNYMSSLKEITESDEYRNFCEKKHYWLIIDDKSLFVEDNSRLFYEGQRYDAPQFVKTYKEQQAAILKEEEEKQAAIRREEEEKQAAIRREEEERQAAIRREEEERQANILWKKGNSNDPGEKEVQYAIKWLLADSPFNITQIEKTCESKYRFNCIILSKPDFIDEPQEYDHILVCDAGVILIETKHWSGRVEIRPDGKWVRETVNDKGVGIVSGEKSPITQVKRHETLIKKILPDVPVYSLICFSNKSIILDGIENCKKYPIIYVDQLSETITDIISNSKIKISIEKTVQEIEKHKINIEEIGIDSI